MPAASTRRSSPRAGWRPALEALARRSATPVGLDVRVEGRLPEQVEIAAYYAVAEALTNTAKHAHASVVQIEVDTLEGEPATATCCGSRSATTAAAAPTSPAASGLLGLKDRAEALGGRLMVLSAHGGGTIVHAELPLSRVHAVPG